MEKNKAWLLPLLGVGVLAVVYTNIRTMSAPPTPPAQPTAETEVPPVADPGVPPGPEVSVASLPTPGSFEADAGQDLWADLRSMAAPPPYLADENTFRDLARRSAMEAIRHEPRPETLILPMGVREPLAPVEAVDTSGKKGSVPPPSIPDLDFLIHGASGSRAWLEGKGYRSGQAIDGNVLSVGPIRPTSVELRAPSGKTQVILSTIPLHSPKSSTRPAVEAP